METESFLPGGARRTPEKRGRRRRKRWARVGAGLVVLGGLAVFVAERGSDDSKSGRKTRLTKRRAAPPALSSGCGICVDAAAELGAVNEAGWSDVPLAAYGAFESRFRHGLLLRNSNGAHKGAPTTTTTTTRDGPDDASAAQVQAALRLDEGTAYSSYEVCTRLAACTPLDDDDDGAFDSIRVTKAMAPRGYGVVRVSRVSRNMAVGKSDLFDYAAPFEHRWTEMSLATGLANVSEAGEATVDVGGGRTVHVEIPRRGEGTLGVWIADPCFSSEFAVCTFGDSYATLDRTPRLLNALLGADASHWAMWGDNLYDRDGTLTRAWWSRLDANAQAKLFLAAPGNHDFWVDGTPRAAVAADQFANGFVQFHAMDTVAALKSNKPFDLTVDPDSRFDASEPGAASVAVENIVWWHAVGNVGYASFSSNYALNATRPYLVQACDWALEALRASDIDLFVLGGHWSTATDGADAGMDVPSVHARALDGALGPSCATLAATDCFKFVQGHTHCNRVALAETGFTVAAQGMADCSEYAFATLDTRGGAAIVVNFVLGSADRDPATDGRYDTLLDCVARRGTLRDCYHLGEVWLNQSLLLASDEDQETF